MYAIGLGNRSENSLWMKRQIALNLKIFLGSHPFYSNINGPYFKRWIFANARTCFLFLNYNVSSFLQINYDRWLSMLALALIH